MEQTRLAKSLACALQSLPSVVRNSRGMNMRNNICAAMICILTLTACNGAGTSAGSSANTAKAAIKPSQYESNSAECNEGSGRVAECPNDAVDDLCVRWLVQLGNFPRWRGLLHAWRGHATVSEEPRFRRRIRYLLCSLLPNDIAKAVKCILDDVVQVAGIATTDLNSALSILNTALAQTTAGSAEYIEIQSMISEIQTLETEYKGALSLVAVQMNLAITFLENLPSMATSLIPVPILSMFGGMLVQQFVQPIIVEIMHFQDQLNSLYAFEIRIKTRRPRFLPWPSLFGPGLDLSRPNERK